MSNLIIIGVVWLAFILCLVNAIFIEHIRAEWGRGTTSKVRVAMLILFDNAVLITMIVLLSNL